MPPQNLTSLLRRYLVFAIVAAQCVAAAAVAQETEPMMDKESAGSEISAEVDLGMCASDGIAIGGYDPVSYRQDGGPLKGQAQFAAEHDGVRYLFASAANRERFGKNPQKYAPAYSGFCAITLALGRITCPEWTNFKIENDRLLLFEVTGFTNGRTLWNSDAASFREQADANYGRLLDTR